MGKSAKAQVAAVFEGEIKLSDFEKALLKERYLNPRITAGELGEKFGLTKQAIQTHLNKPDFKRSMSRLFIDEFAQIRALQTQAIRNYNKILTATPATVEGEKIQYSASRDMLSALIANPAALPTARRELPEFIHDAE